MKCSPCKCMYGQILGLHTKSKAVTVTLLVRWSSLSWKSNRPKVRIIHENKEVLKDHGRGLGLFSPFCITRYRRLLAYLYLQKKCITQRYGSNRRVTGRSSRLLILKKKAVQLCDPLRALKLSIVIIICIWQLSSQRPLGYITLCTYILSLFYLTPLTYCWRKEYLPHLILVLL